MKKQHDRLHLPSSDGAPQASSCGAQTVNTGNERSGRQMNITCRILCSHEEQNGDKQPSVTAPTLQDERFVE